LPQFEYGRLARVLFLAGNESRNNYCLDVYSGQWLKHSQLRPEFGISEQICTGYDTNQGKNEPLIIGSTILEDGKSEI
jgi:hypothetical protein